MKKQRRLIFGARAASGVVLGASCLAASAAHADPCSSLSHVVYVAGSTAQEVFVGGLAAALNQLTPPINVVYQGQGSCTGVGYMSTSGANTITGHGITFAAANASTLYDDGVGCDLDVAGTPVDLGLSDVYPAVCPTATPNTLGTGVKDFFGPVQSMNFVVPIGTGGSDQTSISYEAAHIIFGVGPLDATTNPNGVNVVPWTNPAYYEVRKSSSGTIIMSGAAIGVPGTQWWGNATSGSNAVITNLAADLANGNGENAIGILVSGDIDKNRSSLRPLAFQAKGQTCGYNPDSDPTKFDKQNVRDGHYFIWGPMHMMAHVGANGEPTNPDVQTVVDTLTAKAPPPPGVDLIQIEASNGVVPDCAMRVTRDSEGGDLMSYFPPEGSCACQYVTDATSAKPSYCTTCSSDTDCKNVSTPDGTVAQGKCNNIVSGSGYCEVK